MQVSSSVTKEAPKAFVEVAEFSRRATKPAELIRVRQRLASQIHRLKHKDWVVEIDLGEGEKIIANCRDGVVSEDEGESTLSDAQAIVSAPDFLQLLDGSLDPRYLLLYQRLRVLGSAAIITKFFDLIAARDVSGSLPKGKQLPRPTRDLDLVKKQYAEFGYALVADALPPAQLAALRNRLVSQAAAEVELGVAGRGTGTKHEVPPIQPVWNLINKGQEFVDLLDHPLIDELMPEILGEYFLLSSYTSKIAGPGCDAQIVHTDQISIQPPVEANVGVNLFFFLDDFSEANGGTRLMPFSHLRENRVAPDNVYSTEGTIAAEGPAGTALIFDSRIWHATGANKTDKKRHAVFLYFVRSWLRTMENLTLSVSLEVLESVSERVKIMLGLRCTGALGSVDGPVEGEIVSVDNGRRVMRAEPHLSRN